MITKPPIQIILCSTASDKTSSELVSAVKTAFRGNLGEDTPYIATLSNLDVPMREFRNGPPEIEARDMLDGALHTLVVVVVDSKLETDEDWSQWLKAAEQYGKECGGRHFLLALCLSDEIHKRYHTIEDSDYSDKRGYQEVDPIPGPAAAKSKDTSIFGEYAERATWFALYVLQICRKILTKAIFPDDEKRCSLKLFISHAKKDSLSLANSVRLALHEKSYFSSWYDAEDLNGVDDWREEIRKGVETSVVVVLRTGEYDKRPWCRQEFLWAEQCCVPIVCVEARLHLEFEADPLSTNRVPNVRIPDGNLFRILFPALKESLRILRLRRLQLELEENHPGFKQAKGVELIPYTPTLKHLIYAGKAMEKNAEEGDLNDKKDYQIALYADPPLETEMYVACREYLESRCGKTYLLTPTLLPFWEGHKFSETDENIASYSLMPKTSSRKEDLEPRPKLEINISVSEHVDDFPKLGIGMTEINNAVTLLSQAIIANEGIVALGHDWRNDGVMHEMYKFAEERQEVVLEEVDRPGLIKNYAFWGLPASLTERERNQMKGILDIFPCDPPKEYSGEERFLFQLPKEESGYAFARSLTVMRRTMTEKCFARVCFGGRDMDLQNPDAGPKGRCPGVVEEAFFSCLYDKPLYISAIFGGVIGQVVDAMLGKEEARFQFQLPEDVRACYEENFGSSNPDIKEKGYDGPIESEELIQFFKDYGVERLAENNGLTKEENLGLFRALTIDEVREYVQTGLSRLVAALENR
ncbi:MAG: hypothetical protein CMO55_12130 [Verrucomicrobiales bacterium]|nr:hypothetical protein [Verrucomicrobiales bacterium]